MPVIKRVLFLPAAADAFEILSPIMLSLLWTLKSYDLQTGLKFPPLAAALSAGRCQILSAVLRKNKKARVAVVIVKLRRSVPNPNSW